MASLHDLESGALYGAKHVRIAEGLEAIPRALFELADTLEILDLSGNKLRELPDDFDRFRQLRIAFFSANEFARFPQILGRMPNLEMVGFKSNRIGEIAEDALPDRLRWLILTDNRLRALPAALGRRTRLQKLMLAGNLLEELPDFSGCQALELVRLAANRLRSLPDSLFDLPRLSWLAYAGNPFCATRAFEASAMHWSRLTLHELLGEGASGHIHRAVHQQTDSVQREIAVKIFKGDVTSDGFPRDEREASLSAGRHPHLVPVLGRIEGHPEGRDGIAMELIPKGFRNLGLPPSFETCTRDIFPEGTGFDAESVDRILSGVRSLLDHLHGRSLSHGDLYAHNILVDSTGHALLGDFGAASFLDDLPPRQRDAMIRAENRAFGWLEEDLRTRMADSVIP